MTGRGIRRLLVAAIAALALPLSQAVAAATSDVTKDEIDHLLNYVATSSCTFIRNGSEYPADQARDHLAGKYRFVGTRISTADEFIAYLATKSSLSGEPYRVRCGNVDALSGAWLAAELKRYRALPRLQHVSR